MHSHNHHLTPSGSPPDPTLEEPLSSHVEIHDRFSLELKLQSRSEQASTDGETHVDYHVDTYLFFPQSLHVSGSTYPTDAFYQDSRAFLRRDSPSLWRDDDTLDPTLLQHLRSTIARAAHALTPPPDPHHLAQAILLFGCALRHSLKETWRILPTTPVPSPHHLTRVAPRLRALASTSADFRELRRRLLDLVDLLPRDIHDAALTVDEALSYFLETALARIDQRLAEHPLPHPTLDTLRATVRRMADTELAYRRRAGFCIQAADNHSREYFLYRFGQLKKAMDSVLYFDVRTLRTPSRVRHLIGAIGAALAAVWAFLAQLSTIGPTGAPVAGMSTFLLFSIVVGAYILKDRIKDITKESLGKWLLKRTPDKRSVFTSNSLEGELFERASFISFSELPHPIAALRDSGHVVEAPGDQRETLLAYHKRLHYTFSSPELASSLDVKDLFRFNVRRLLTYLDDPQRPLLYFDPQTQSFTSALAPKIYHLNIVLAYTLGVPGELGSDTTYERLRVILDRDGIVRIESVLPRGHHTWLLEPQS